MGEIWIITHHGNTYFVDAHDRDHAARRFFAWLAMQPMEVGPIEQPNVISVRYCADPTEAKRAETVGRAL